MRYLLVFILTLSLFLVMGCETAPQENDGQLTTMGRVEEPMPVDGSSAKYPSAPAQLIDVDVHMAHDGDHLYTHMQAEAEGWVAVGFNTLGGRMDGANMVIGYLDGESPAFRDDVGQTLNHVGADTTAVEEFYLSQEDGTMVMEFSYPLSFPDEEGYNLEEMILGEDYTMIVSLHSSSNDIDQQHSSRGSVDFTIEPYTSK